MSLFVRVSALTEFFYIPTSGGAETAIAGKHVSPSQTLWVAASAQGEGTGLPEG